MSAVDIFFDGSCSCGNWNAGAGLLISGEGISCGSPPRRSVTKITNTRPRNSTKGINKYLFMLFNGGRRGSGRHVYGLWLRDGLRNFLFRERVSPVTYGKEAAERHQQGAAPNPID